MYGVREYSQEITIPVRDVTNVQASSMHTIKRLG